MFHSMKSSSISSPGFSGALDLSQPVAPPFGVFWSKPVAASCDVPTAPLQAARSASVLLGAHQWMLMGCAPLISSASVMLARCADGAPAN